MKIYVASSWRNEYQQSVVSALRTDGHDVYDFRNPRPGNHGFSWKQIDPEREKWTAAQYLDALSHSLSESGFESDMGALRACDVCVMVMPCGSSASMEMGWAVGAGKKVAVYVPAYREPELMIKMAHLVTTDLSVVLNWISSLEPSHG